MAGKKLFTAIMNYAEGVTAGISAWSRAAESFEAQENITIKAVLMNCAVKELVEHAAAADDDYVLRAQLSQAGQEEDEGVIAECQISIYTGTQGAVTPAQIIADCSSQLYIELPGNGITVKEDGDVNLHVFRENTSSGTATFGANVIIYYEKG